MFPPEEIAIIVSQIANVSAGLSGLATLASSPNLDNDAAIAARATLNAATPIGLAAINDMLHRIIELSAEAR